MACMHAKLLLVCPTLCNPMDHSPPGSSVHGISQARMLDWVATCFSRESSQLRDQTKSPALAGGFFTTEPPGKPIRFCVCVCVCVCVLVAQSCRTLCYSMDNSLADSSVHGILQARILERVDFPFSRRSSQFRDRTWVSCIAGRFFTV